MVPSAVTGTAVCSVRPDKRGDHPPTIRGNTPLRQFIDPTLLLSAPVLSALDRQSAYARSRLNRRSRDALRMLKEKGGRRIAIDRGREDVPLP